MAVLGRELHICTAEGTFVQLMADFVQLRAVFVQLMAVFVQLMADLYS